ncbi:amidase family protein, partial [Actinomadura geliboluensis]
MNGRPAPAPPAPISAAAELVASRALSPVDLTETCLRVIEAREPDVSAFAAVDGERALREARLLEDELLRTGPRSPLHGVPVAVKDLLDVEGLPTRAGSPVLGGAPPAASDAAAVAALRAAGAVVIGKTHTHE